MGIGGSIFLIALGAIIAFGVNNQSLGPFDLNVVGWVLMLAGLLGFVLTFYFWNSRRRRVITQGPAVERDVVETAPPTAGPSVVDEQRWTAPPDRRL
jgi:hypothetical protein